MTGEIKRHLLHRYGHMERMERGRMVKMVFCIEVRWREGMVGIQKHNGRLLK